MVRVRELDEDNLPSVRRLWRASQGVIMRDKADTKEALIRYLDRNPGMSFGAFIDDQLVGAVLSGHDGRRGYIHHLAVECNHRGKGIGRRLVESAIAALQEAGIVKCHAFVLTDNDGGKEFWQHLGWSERSDIGLHSYVSEGDPNA